MEKSVSSRRKRWKWRLGVWLVLLGCIGLLAALLVEGLFNSADFTLASRGRCPPRRCDAPERRRIQNRARDRVGGAGARGGGGQEGLAPPGGHRPGDAPDRLQVGINNAFARGADAIAFEVQPGDTAVMPGGMVALRCRVKPAGVFRTARLAVRETRNPQPATRNLQLSGDTCRVVLAAGHGFEYRFRVLDRSSDPHRVRVLEPLSLERLVFTLNPPAYSGLPETRTSGAEISGLKGTVVGIEGAANRLMSAGRLVLENKDGGGVCARLELPK